MMRFFGVKGASMIRLGNRCFFGNLQVDHRVAFQIRHHDR